MGKQSDKKRKPKEDEDGTDVITAQLASYGEKFMQMFEPTDVDTRNTSENASSDEYSDNSSLDDSDIDSSAEEETGDEWNDAADAAVEQIFNKSKKTTLPPGAKRLPKTTLAPSRPSLPSPEMEELERKRFMSHRAGVVSGAVPVGGNSTSSRKKGRKSEEKNGSSIFHNVSGKLNKEEFQKLTREVHLYGATALDKKSKKQFDAAVLEGLGAKKAKAVKMPTNMAIGMAKKRAKREAVALEEAIASGMIQVKGMGKKKRAEKKAGLDRGLNEDGGAFRNGVLKIGKISSGRGGSAAGAARGGSSGGRGGGRGGKRGGFNKGGGGSRRGGQALTMRRSARLLQAQTGGVKKNAQQGVIKSSETSNNPSSTVPRRRGLFQDAPEQAMIHDTFIVAEHVPERPLPPSPFLPDQNAVQDLPQPPSLHDENTPPPKRRHIHTDAEEMPLEEEMSARANSHQEDLHADQPEAATQPTWFTPIRPTRPPVVDPEFTPTGMPSRMPSFAMWIDGVEIPEEELLLPAAATAPTAPTAPLPPAPKDPTPVQATPGPSACTAASGGVDMTDLARLYDPQIAAAVAKSPPTPIEKLCKSLVQ